MVNNNDGNIRCINILIIKNPNLYNIDSLSAANNDFEEEYRFQYGG